MSVLKGIVIAFSTFSKIPMPQFVWKDKEVGHMFVGFPLVGVVLSFLTLWLYKGISFLELNDLSKGVLLTIFPILITGGIHLDGFMDTMDGIASYKSREERLAILKDSHIGAFGVIGGIVLVLLQVSALSMLSSKMLLPYLGIFPISRCLSGLASLYFAITKEEGSLSYFRKTHSKLSLVSLWMMLIGVIGYYAFIEERIFLIGVGILFFIDIFVIIRLRKIFGGMTGDLAGYFLTLNEMIFPWIILIVLKGGLL